MKKHGKKDGKRKLDLQLQELRNLSAPELENIVGAGCPFGSVSGCRTQTCMASISCGGVTC
jgi:hypothetical protein